MKIRNIILSVVLLLMIVNVLMAGFNFGHISAVKRKIKELEDQVDTEFIELDSIIGGAYNTNIKLTKSNSPYIVNDHLLSQHRCVIEPGVIIKVENGFIFSCDQLTAEGTENNPIVFTSVKENPESGDWSGLQINGGPRIIENSSIKYATIEYADTGIKISYSGVGASQRIVNTSIRNCNTGVSLYELGTNAIIMNNIFSGNSYSLRCNNSGNAEVTYNNFEDFNHGIALDPEAGTVKINKNNIVGSSGLINNLIENFTEKTINAEYNWFGTTDTIKIENLIYDDNDDSTKGEIDFMPIQISSITEAGF